jgi:hypothetical protein
MTPLDQALVYIARSWPIFPCSSDGHKHPLIPDWPNAASTDTRGHCGQKIPL